MKNSHPNILVKALLYWYIFIFLSTEFLSYLHLIERSYIILGEGLFWVIFLFFHRQEILQNVQAINLRSKSVLLIIVLFILTFIQGFFSAPNSTDSMVYHLPRMMFWIQEKTLFQDVIRSAHDYMPPFGQYILLHLYLIFGNDRFLFFSQWTAYVITVIISGVIASRLGANRQVSGLISLLVASIPVVVMQSTSTKIEMIVAVLVIISAYLALHFKPGNILDYLALSLSLGFGILTKQTFLIYSVIPLGIFIVKVIKGGKRSLLLSLSMLVIILVIQARFILQNFLLYENKVISDNDYSGYTTQNLTLAGISSNLIKNIMLQVPIPIYTKQVEDIISLIHSALGIDINDCSTTFCDPAFRFRIVQMVYPQEDIASNPLHFLLIVIAGLVLIRQLLKRRLNLSVFFVFSLAVLSFILFSALLKWQPFHSRFHIPFLVMGTIPAVLVLIKSRKGLYFLKGILTASFLLALLLISLSVLKPYISYKLFSNTMKLPISSLSGMPESFFLKPYNMQYFNTRPYWYEPYLAIASLVAQKNEKDTIAFQLMDDFEYPLWLLLKRNNVKARIIPYSQITDNTLIISTTEQPFYKEGYDTVCSKTLIEYGYACILSRDRH